MKIKSISRKRLNMLRRYDPRTGFVAGFTIILILLLTGCSPVDMIKAVLPGGDGVTVETELVAGDKEVAAGAVVGKRESNTYTADNITNNAPVVNEANPWWWSFLGGFLLGWLALPDLIAMWRKVKGQSGTITRT